MNLNKNNEETQSNVLELDDKCKINNDNILSYESKIRLNTMRKELDETKIHMAKNIEKLLDRDSKLCDVNEKTRALVKHSDIFNKSCKKLTWYSWFYSKISYIFAGGATSLAVVMYLVL